MAPNAGAEDAHVAEQMGAGWLHAPVSRHSEEGDPSSTYPLLQENVAPRPTVSGLGELTAPLVGATSAGQNGRHVGAGLLHAGPGIHVVVAAPER